MRCPDCSRPVVVVESLLGGYARVRCPEHGTTTAIDRAPVIQTPPPAPAGAFDAGMAGSELATAKWTPVDVIAVDLAIRDVASRMAEFTADDVWAELGPDFPVTKGLASRLNSARHRGLIEPTNMVSFSRRTGEHGHGQRLSVWRSRIVRVAL